MKNKGLIVTTIVFFLLINTSYYWEVELGIFAMPASLILLIIFMGLGVVLFWQFYSALLEKFKDKQRLLTLVILTLVLTLTFFKPFGFINFDKFEGNDILIAKREGAANCMTTFKLKENNKFSERIVCFGMSETSGNYKLKNDTIFFENIKSGRHDNDFYKFAVIKKSKFNWNKGGFEIFRYKNYNDTVGNYLTITLNELNILSSEKPNR
jgi:hypothetical protein